MKKFLLGPVALVVLAAPASAADLAPYTKAPPPMIAPVYDWSGFYIGGNGGWGSSRKCWDFVTPAGAFVAAEGCHDATGGTAGGQIGLRWQTGTWVFGFEGQGNWADFKGNNVSLFAANFVNQSKIDAFGLFTGQIGWTANNVLFYVKGGGAVVSDDYRVLATGLNTVVATTGNGDSTRWGAVVGAGFEFGFGPNWSVGIEYDHIFLEDRTHTFLNNGAIFPTGTLFGTERISQDVDLVTVRVNYRFGGPVIPKY